MNKAKSNASHTAPLAPCAYRRIRNRTGANGADITSPVRCGTILAKSNGPDIDADQLLPNRNGRAAGRMPATGTHLSIRSLDGLDQ
jgi:hypothetical protein